MIYDLIYHAKRGPTKVSLKFLEQCFDTTDFREILNGLQKLRIRRLYTDGINLVLESY